jgi:hypothetical protein
MATLKFFIGPSVTMLASDPRMSARALTSDNRSSSRTLQTSRILSDDVPVMRYSPADKSMVILPLETKSRSSELEGRRDSWASSAGAATNAIPMRATERLVRM